MNELIDLRSQIYDYFHNNGQCKNYFFHPEQKELYAAFYTSMYLIQDSTESLLSHREQGFNQNCYLAYIEFWGIMQAIIIQQDSIKELYKVLKGSEPKIKNNSAWNDIRYLRKLLAGHPAKQDRSKGKPFKRSFMGRHFGNYQNLVYEQYEKGSRISHHTIFIGSKIDAYAEEAKEILLKAFISMKKRWP